ncbi:MAG: YheC/YheD family protein [Heyndrickxia sp.]
MNIYFHPKKNTFIHIDKKNGPYFWGKNDELLPCLDEDVPPFFLFNMKKNKMRIGPLIGILISRNSRNEVIGDSDMYIGIQKELQKHGGLSFLYSLDDCKKDYINGICYCTEDEKWIQANFPYPQLVYNRISFRKQEIEEAYIQHVEWLRNNDIILFNPGFIDKFLMHQIFSKNSQLKSILPETIFIEKDSDALQQFLLTHKRLYLKPTKSSQGNGIKLLTHETDNRFQIRTNAKIEYLTTYPVLIRYLENYCFHQSYIAQKAIDSDLINGKKYDFRILSHFEKGQYKITGIGVRMAKKDGITTHVSKGGDVVPFQTSIHKRLVHDFKKIVEECGKSLSNHLGFFGEFSMDIGMDTDGKLWIFEVNAKPMKFDESEIERKKMTRLIQLFYELTHF